VILALLLSCASDPPVERLPQMGPLNSLARISMDLRGVRPSVAELEAVEADPGALGEVVDGFFDDPGFESRVRDLMSEIYLTRFEDFYVSAADYGLEDEAAFRSAVQNEVLRMVGHVAANDLPWTELVTGDWTLANEVLGSIWPLDYPEGETGWRKAHYTDGRPAAGVLSTNSLWWRYPSNAANYNRHRANAVSRIFLCEDYLKRPIEFDGSVDFLDSEAVQEALVENPACVNCHVSLDPLASFLYGFWWYTPDNVADVSVFHPERELAWRNYTGIAPGYFGEPGSTLADLGRFLAADKRFPECIVKQSWQLLLGREATLDDTAALSRHRNAFVDGGGTLSALLGSIVWDRHYLSGPTDDAGATPIKLVTADLMASQVKDLTGFVWEYEGYDMMRTDQVGVRLLAGGFDGANATTPARTPNATLLLVQERLAELGAAYVVAQDAVTDSPRLFDEVDFTETPEDGEAVMIRQVQSLFWRLYGERIAADGEEAVAVLELWRDLYQAEGNIASTWAAVLSALLRDPEMLVY
jgi:hypothetical protein